MNLSEKIKEISQVRSKEYPILSLYLPFLHRSPTEMEKQRIFFKNVEKALHEKGYPYLVEDLKRARSYLDRHLEKYTHGVAIFSCFKENIFHAIQLWVPVYQYYHVGYEPALRQLIRLKDDYEETMVIGVSSELGRILRITPEGVVEELLATEDFPGRHDQGGWSQARFQRHVEEHMMRHFKKVAERAIKEWDGNHYGFLILWGQEHLIREFIHLLPKRMVDKYAGVINGDLRTDEGEAINKAIHLLRQVEEKRALEEIETMTKARKVLISWDTLLPLLNQGRIYKLFVKAFSSTPGWACPSCEVVGQNTLNHCPVCQQPVETVDLVEAAMVKVEKQGGKVEVSTQIPYEVAGIVRY